MFQLFCNTFKLAKLSRVFFLSESFLDYRIESEKWMIIEIVFGFFIWAIILINSVLGSYKQNTNGITI